jgi:hypothetical protein
MRLLTLSPLVAIEIVIVYPQLIHTTLRVKSKPSYSVRQVQPRRATLRFQTVGFSQFQMYAGNALDSGL